MRKLLFLTGWFLFSVNIIAQPLAAYHNYNRQFVIFDNGKKKVVENVPVKSFQIGKKCIAYVANTGQFKVYYDGDVQSLAVGNVERYYATRNLLFYFVYSQLYVFDSGKTRMLSSNVNNFAIGDDLVVFYNVNKKASYAYYNGELEEIERSLTGAPITKFAAGDNIFAYFNDNTKYLKVFYQGNLQNLFQSNGQVSFRAGKNIIAYIDHSENSFHAFYNDEVYDLEDFRPKSFIVGDDILAYVDNTGSFKVFSAGEVYTVSSFEPDTYKVKDNLVAFSELEYFKVFYKDEVYELESYTPENFQMKDGALAYLNVNGWLKAFVDGKSIIVTKDLIKAFVLTYDLIYATTSVNTIKMFYKEKL